MYTHAHVCVYMCVCVGVHMCIHVYSGADILLHIFQLDHASKFAISQVTLVII